MKITEVVPKPLLIAVGVLGLVAVIFVVGLLLSGGRKPGNGGIIDGNGDDGGADGGPRTEVKNPNSSTAFKYAGISKQDTLVFVDDSGDEVFTQLDHKSWKDVKWSPDGTLVSALGKTAETTDKQPIFDLFIYDFKEAQWKQITFFQDSGTGITGYDWAKDLHVVFTQGPVGEIWLHDYDYPNAELLKKFQMVGTLQDYLEGSDQYLVKRITSLDLTNLNKGKIDDNTFDLLDRKGKVVKSFNGFKESNQALKINQISLGRSEEEFLFTVHNYVAEKDFYYVWSFVTPEFKELTELQSDTQSLALFCGQDLNLVYAAAKVGTELWWGSFSPDTNSFAAISELKLYGSITEAGYPKMQFSCDQSPQLLRAVTKDGQNDYVQFLKFEQGKFSEVEFKNPLVWVAAKIGS
jgi:hypothetical protein